MSRPISSEGITVDGSPPKTMQLLSNKIVSMDYVFHIDNACSSDVETGHS